jgi:probable rRNA maturation factor
MSVDLVFRNRQRRRKIDVRYLRRITLTVVAEVLREDPGGAVNRCELGIHLVAAAEMVDLNRRFLGHEGSTDVITLDYTDAPRSTQIVGDIFVCLDEAIAQARRFRTTWQSELVRYVIHGILHLRGYDDVRAAERRVMKREEERLLNEAAGRFPLRTLARVRK